MNAPCPFCGKEPTDSNATVWCDAGSHPLIQMSKDQWNTRVSVLAAGMPSERPDFINYVANGGDELAKTKAELAYALGCLEREINISHQLRAQVEELKAKVQELTPKPPEPMQPVSVLRGPPTEEELATAFSFLCEKPSTSFIQRKMGIGYNHAAAIMETLEIEGCISVPDSAGRRTILKRDRFAHPSTERS